jgi:predicted PurR-regulated permease PerM
MQAENGNAGPRDSGRDVRAASDADRAWLAAAAEASTLAEHEEPALGEPGPPLDRRSPFMIGLQGAIGVATAFVLLLLLRAASGVLALIILALFVAIGLEPAVRRLMGMRLPRWAAVTVVTLLMIGVVGGFLAAAIPPLIAQTEQFLRELPTYFKQLNDHSSTLGRIDARFHVHQRLTQLISSAGGGTLFGGLLGAGRIVLGAVAATLTGLVLTTYLLADMPRIRRLAYRLIPASRRPRAIMIGDEMLASVGGYVLGNLITSLIAGAGTFVWLAAWDIPYPLLLSIMVALFDLIPVIGSPLAGVIVSLVALTVSLPVAAATGAFYAGYKLAEDYLLVPRIIGRTVDVPATATLVAVLLGGTALGLIGALIAIPVAAALRVLLREVVFPRLDRS